MGEVTVTGSQNGKPLTLDPVGEKSKIEIDAWEVESTLAAGFRQNWVEGGNDEFTIDLNVGAGVGSRWGTFTYKRKSDGEEVQIVFHAGDLVEALAALAEQKLAERDHVQGTA